MGTTMIRADTLGILGKLQKDFPNKSPFIFSKRNAFGFEELSFKTFSADDEMVIPGVMCINEEILNLLTDREVVNHIDGYMGAASNRSPVMGSAGVYRSMAVVLMLSCVKYTFNSDVFPYVKNADINQMWADVEQMGKGNHVVCNLISAVVRGRSHEGFTKQHAVRCQVPPVSILDVPKFVIQARQGMQMWQQPLPLLRRQPPPPPPRKQPPPPGSALPEHEGNAAKCSANEGSPALPEHEGSVAKCSANEGKTALPKREGSAENGSASESSSTLPKREITSHRNIL
jgi:hypothetical protein